MAVLASPFKSKIQREAENATLRHQLVVLRRKAEGPGSSQEQRPLVLRQLYRWFPSILPVLMIIRPETPVGIEPAFAAIGIGNRVDGRRPPIEAENRHVSAVESEYKALRRDRSIFLASPLATTPSMSECVMAFVTKRLNASDLLMPI